MYSFMHEQLFWYIFYFLKQISVSDMNVEAPGIKQDSYTIPLNVKAISISYKCRQISKTAFKHCFDNRYTRQDSCNRIVCG